MDKIETKMEIYNRIFKQECVDKIRNNMSFQKRIQDAIHSNKNMPIGKYNYYHGYIYPGGREFDMRTDYHKIESDVDYDIISKMNTFIRGNENISGTESYPELVPNFLNTFEGSALSRCEIMADAINGEFPNMGVKFKCIKNDVNGPGLLRTQIILEATKNL